MFDYILRMLILLPLVAGMAVGALWLYRKMGPEMSLTRRERKIAVVDALSMGTAGRLAVVEYDGRQLLLAVTRGRIEVLSEGPITPAPGTEQP